MQRLARALSWVTWSHPGARLDAGFLRHHILPLGLTRFSEGGQLLKEDRSLPDYPGGCVLNVGLQGWRGMLKWRC